MHFHIIDQLSQELLTHPEYGLWITFFLAFLESLPVLGTIFPGAIFMTVVGILAGRGLISFYEMILVSSIGAYLGDLIGFWLGRAFHDKIPHWPVFRKRQHWLDKGRVFFDKHGGKGVLIGRFFGPIRSTVPMVAGLLRMSWARFIPVALLAAVVWSISYLLPGVLIGAISLQLSTPQVTLFLVSAIAVIVALWATYWLCQRFFLYLSDLGRRTMQSLWQACQGAKGLRYVMRAITNKENQQDYHQLTRLLIAVCLLLVLCVFAVNVFTGGPLTLLNHPLFYLLQSIHRTLASDLMFGITMLGDKYVVGGATLLLAGVLAWQKQWRQMRYLLITVLIGVVSIKLFKTAFYEPRPMGLAHPVSTSAYPSGHTTLTTLFYGLLAYWVKQQIALRWRTWVTGGSLLLMALVGFSRLYLGAHWFLDVMSAYCLGSAILLLSITLFRRKPKQGLCDQKKWVLAIVCSVLLVWSCVTWTIGSRVFSGFQPIWPTQMVSEKHWLQKPTMVLPSYRRNRVGFPGEPFNVQWAGPMRCITANLLYQGWDMVTHVSSIKSLLSHFISSNPHSHLFLFQRLHRQRSPVIYMMKQIPGTKRLAVLRLWSSGVLLDTGVPLWVGTVDVRLPRKGSFSFPSHRLLRYNDMAENVLLSSFTEKTRPQIQVVTAKHLSKKLLTHLRWYGTVIVLDSRERNAAACL